MKYHHQDLANGCWQKLNLIAQLANVGTEVERAINWRQKAEIKKSRLAFFRSLELIDLTIADLQSKNRVSSLKELCRLREFLVDDFFGDNLYGLTDTLWQKYFYPFNWAARLHT